MDVPQGERPFLCIAKEKWCVPLLKRTIHKLCYADLFHVPHKAKGHVVQVDVFIRGFAHGDPVAVDLPHGIALEVGSADFKDMVPASAFQILLLPDKADQLQTTEIEGGECVFDAGFKQGFCVPDAAQLKGTADHSAIIFHSKPPLQLAVCLIQKFLAVYNDALVAAGTDFSGFVEGPQGKGDDLALNSGDFRLCPDFQAHGGRGGVLDA